MTPHFVLEVALRMALRADKAHKTYSVSNRIQEFQWYEGYACSTEKYEKGIIAGNWNSVTEYDQATKTQKVISDIPVRLERIFSKMGVEIEWSDGVSSCHDCGLLCETEPTHYGWEPRFKIVNDCELLCLDCCPEEDEEEEPEEGTGDEGATDEQQLQGLKDTELPSE